MSDPAAPTPTVASNTPTPPAISPAADLQRIESGAHQSLSESFSTATHDSLDVDAASGSRSSSSSAAEDRPIRVIAPPEDVEELHLGHDLLLGDEAEGAKEERAKELGVSQPAVVSAELGAALAAVPVLSAGGPAHGPVSEEKWGKEHSEASGTGGSAKGESFRIGDDAVVAMDEGDLANLTEEQKKAVLSQVHVDEKMEASFLSLFRHSNRWEIFLNCCGVFAAIVAGVAQPLMTIVFGNLTNAFSAYTIALGESDNSAASIAALTKAKSSVFSQVNHDILYLIYIGIAMFFATWIYMGTWVYSGEATTRRIRETYLRSVLRQNVAYFDKIGPGDIVTRIQVDTHLIQEGISDKVPQTAMLLGMFVSGFVVGIVRNWRLALVLCVIIPVLGISGALVATFLGKFRLAMLDQIADGGALAEEAISSVRTLHAFGSQRRLVSMYDTYNGRTLKLGIKSATVLGCGLASFFFVIYCAYALCFYWGVSLIIMGHASAGIVVNVFMAILMAAFSLSQITPNLQAFAYARGAAASLYSTIDRVPPIDSSDTGGLKPDKVDAFLELTDVDFFYPSRPSVQVLHKFSGVFPKGEMTALVGASGSGKSTIVGLVERFYDPASGEVKLDGVDIKELNLKWLRSQIGLVSQEPTLFATTVAGNIEHGLIGSAFDSEGPAERRARVVAAAKKANADGFISALPEGYDTMIGERGMLLSGGQKQRIAIARAIISEPPILLLDEATSALDTASESIVQHALDTAAAGRTTIAIAHRLSTIKDAHQIIVMSAGHVLERAISTPTTSAHQLLLEQKGAYSRLVDAQAFRDQKAEDSDSDTLDAEKGELHRLTSAEAEELARNEKPEFDNLHRTATDRSFASVALSARRGGDLEAGGKARKSVFYLISRMVRLNKGRTFDYIMGFSGSVLLGMVYPVFGIVFGHAIGVFSIQIHSVLRSQGNREALYAFIIAIVAMLGVACQAYFCSSSSERLSAILRTSVFAAMLRQDISYFDIDENSTGHLTSSISDWAQNVNGLMGVTSGVIIQSCFTLIGGSIIGLCYGWRVALVGIACYPFTIAAGIVRLKVVVLKDARNKKSHQQSAQMACEAASAIRTVASLTREDDCCAIYSKYLDEPQRVSNRVSVWSSAFYALSQCLTFFVLGLVFWYGSHQLVEGKLTTTSFFVTLMSVIFGSIQAGNVFTYVPDMSKAFESAGDIVTLLDSTPEIDADDPSGTVFADAKGLIQLQDVHFRYPTRPHVPVLRGLNLEVLPGQFIAIVGPSGCGKSTLIQLVERFYDPLGGKVRVDGFDISTLNVKSYREEVALVSQEPTLYQGTVRFNVILGAVIPAEEVTQEAVEQACRDANIHDFVMSLPDGYDTQVGGKGAQLSGGQKQRIAIARALIRNPKILLLDEATSALDSESEKVVQLALDKAAKGRSTIAVAHRLSTIQGADCIYVLKDGKVAEKGKHFELLAMKGIYNELVSQQELEKRP